MDTKSKVVLALRKRVEELEKENQRLQAYKKAFVQVYDATKTLEPGYCLNEKFILELAKEVFR